MRFKTLPCFAKVSIFFGVGQSPFINSPVRSVAGSPPRGRELTEAANFAGGRVANGRVFLLESSLVILPQEMVFVAVIDDVPGQKIISPKLAIGYLVDMLTIFVQGRFRIVMVIQIGFKKIQQAPVTAR